MLSSIERMFCLIFLIYYSRRWSFFSQACRFSNPTYRVSLISLLSSSIISSIFFLSKLTLSFCIYIYFDTLSFKEAMFIKTTFVYSILKSIILNFCYTYLFSSFICLDNYSIILNCS
jgi:hypothetical protein